MNRHLMRTAGLVAIGVLALSGCGGGGPTDAGASASSTEDKPICQQEASDATTIDSAPEVEWVEHEGRPATPKSEDLGPAEEKDGIGTCYRHSPEGALVASTDYMLTLLSFDTEKIQKLVDVQGIGEDKDKIVQEIQDMERSASSEEIQQALQHLKVAGFQVEDYTEDESRISIAYDLEHQGRHAQTAFTFQVTWTDGDWKLSHDSISSDGAAQDLTGYTPWGPGADVLKASESASPSASSGS